jgi:hypothetical protein
MGMADRALLRCRGMRQFDRGVRIHLMYLSVARVQKRTFRFACVSKLIVL